MGSHLGYVSSLIDMFNVISSILQNIDADVSAGLICADEDTAFNHLSSFEFVFIMCLMREILKIAEMFGKYAILLVSSTKELLQKMRSNVWEGFLAKVVKFCVTHRVDVPNMEETYILRGGHAQHQPHRFTNERYY